MNEYVDTTTPLLNSLKKEVSRIPQLKMYVDDLINMYDILVYPYEFHELLIYDWVNCYCCLNNSNSIYKHKYQKQIIQQIMELNFYHFKR